MKNIQTITPAKISQCCKLLADAGLTGMFWGRPGIGKSKCVQQFCEKDGRTLTDVRVSTLDTPDLRGMTYIDAKNRKTIWLTPEFFPTHDESCIFLDELNRGRPDIQNASLQLILDRRLGNYVVPKGTVILAAGNFAEDGHAVFKMDDAMSDRIVHYNVEVSLDSFMEWAVPNRIHPSVLAFLKTKPEYLEKGPNLGEVDMNQVVYPTPRSWERVSTVLKTYPQRDEIQRATIAGIIGKAAQSAFLAIVDELDKLPAIEELLSMKPEDACKHPGLQTTSALFGLLYSLDGYCKTFEQLEKSLMIFFKGRGIKDAGNKVNREDILVLAAEMLVGRMFEMDKTKTRVEKFVNSPEVEPWLRNRENLRAAIEAKKVAA